MKCFNKSLSSYKLKFIVLQFGDSQQLRMVRILRSTLMVRVGGGWTALDEFLVKNDPCRGANSQCSSLFSCKKKNNNFYDIFSTFDILFYHLMPHFSKVPPQIPAVLPNSERQDQPEDQGEVPVPWRKHLERSHC